MRKQWTEQMIATELAAVISTLNKMPSAADLRQLGRNDLAVQVGRKGGYLAWAERLGATRAKSDSDTGWTGEIDLAKNLVKRGFTVERMTAVTSPYDLDVNHALRLDVKTASYAEYGACRGWFYRVGKAIQADVLALYQIDTGVCYFLPWTIGPQSNITISRSGGKYAEFRDRYDILKRLCDARRNEVLLWPGFTYRGE